jgi:hypothetical protein
MAGTPRDCDTTQVDVFISSHEQNATFVDCLRRLLIHVGGSQGGHHHVPLKVVVDEHGIERGNSNDPGRFMEHEARACRIGG